MPKSTTAAQDIILPNLNAAYNLASWLTRDPVLAEDVVQDAVARALTYAHSFRGENARAWLLQIVRNAAYATLAERYSADQCGPGDDIADQADGPEVTLAKQEEQVQLKSALAALPPDLRECLVLRELEELSYKEIVAVTGVPMGTVMSRLWRARQALLGVYAKGRQS